MRNSKSGCEKWKQHTSCMTGNKAVLSYVPWVTSVTPLEEYVERFCKSMLGALLQHDPAMSVLEVLMNLSVNLTTCRRMGFNGIKHVWKKNVF